MSNEVTARPKNVSNALDNPAIQKRISDLLGKRAPQFCSTIVQISKLSHVHDCEPMSIIGSAITAASMDLSIDPNLGFAHIVPYNSKEGKIAQFQMGYKGYIQLGLRTGQYAQMNDFKVNREAFISFSPITGDLKVDESKLDEDSADIIGYGFYFRLTNGFEKTAYWPKEKIERHAKRFSKSYAKGYGPWKDMFDAMALKTVIKLTLGKYGILSTDMQKALSVDQATVTTKTDGDDSIAFFDAIPRAEGMPTEEPNIPESTTAAPDPDVAGQDLNGDNRPTRDLANPANMKKSELLRELFGFKNHPKYDSVVLGKAPNPSEASAELLRGFVTELRAG